MLGKDQPVHLSFIDLPNAQNALNVTLIGLNYENNFKKGVAMEVQDCAFPLLAGISKTDSFSAGFKDVDYALLVGAKPRGPGLLICMILSWCFLLGMERGDLLKENAKIFIDTGKAINDNAKRNIKVLVVGNPANTNALITSTFAKDIPKENFTAMTRLDHNRALYQLADRTGVHIDEIEKLAIWGNHSPTMYADITNATVKGKLYYLLISNY